MKLTYSPHMISSSGRVGQTIKLYEIQEGELLTLDSSLSYGVWTLQDGILWHKHNSDASHWNHWGIREERWRKDGSQMRVLNDSYILPK